MLTIQDEDAQTAVITAVFDALDDVGPHADDDQATVAVLQHLFRLHGSADDVRALIEEEAIRPWAIAMWPLVSGELEPKHVAAEPAYPKRPHPATMQTGAVPVQQPELAGTGPGEIGFLGPIVDEVAADTGMVDLDEIAARFEAAHTGEVSQAADVEVLQAAQLVTPVPAKPKRPRRPASK